MNQPTQPISLRMQLIRLHVQRVAIELQIKLIREQILASQKSIDKDSRSNG